MNTLLQDLRYAVRMLARSPGFTAVAIATLALGIGANTAIFSAINAVLLRPLPYAEASRIVIPWATNPKAAAMGYPELPPTYNDVTEWRSRSQSFESVAACRPEDRTLTDGDTPERVGGAVVTHDFFSLFGVAPRLGRAFTKEEDSPGRNQVAVISSGLWQRRYGGDRAIVGQTITLGGVRYTVVGVMPPEFQFPRGAELPAGYGFAPKIDLWVPFGLSATDWVGRNNRQIVALGRLRPGVTLSAAQTELSGIAARLERQFQENTDMGVKLMPLRDQMVSFSRTPLLMLFGAAGLVLLIACANIASLLLARATVRQREIAIRSALGARPAGIIRQLLVENVLLASLGALLAIGFARLAIATLLRFGPANLPQLQETRLDLGSFAFTAVAALAAALLFGLVPALQATRSDLQQVLRNSGANVTGGRQFRLREKFVVIQIALALTLLVGSALLIRSLAAVLAVDSGFRPESVLTFELGLSGDYDNVSRRASFFNEFRNRLESLPGVRAVGTISRLPMGGGEGMTGLIVEGAPPPRDNDQFSIQTEERRVAGSYFQAMGITLVKGRLLTDQEVSQQTPRVVINETLARRFFAAQDPIGKRIRIGNSGTEWREIVGVVQDVKSGSLEAPSRPQVYQPTLNWGGSMAVVVRASGDPRGLVGRVRAELKAVDSGVPLTKIRTMQEVVDLSVVSRRFNMLLLGLFAVLALVLTTIGLYGSVAYWVSQRTREFGIRRALGGQTEDVMKLVMKQGLRLTLVGVVIGLVSAFAVTRVLSHLLFGISPTDPVAFSATAFLLVTVALFACYLPARRATRIDPMVALRCE
jgi:putative ABC transport system permease protein